VKDHFLSVVCLDGSATVNGEPMEKGDSFFLPTGLGEVTVTGRCEILVTAQG
jgi:mannose-6-phosphate isomerase class I